MKSLYSLFIALAATGFTYAQDRPSTINKDVVPHTTDQSHSMLMPTTKLIGATVKDSDGDKCGDINSFVFDSSGQVQYVIVGVGGVAGVGESEIAVPWGAFSCKCTMDNGKMVCDPRVKVPAKQLSAASKLDAKKYVELTDGGWVAKNATFFRVDKPASSLTASNMICTSKIINATVKSKNDESVGVLDDLMIRNGTGKTEFAILGRGGVAGIGKTYVAIPLKALNFTHKENDVHVSVQETKEQLDGGIRVTPSEYPELNLKSVTERVSQTKPQ